MKAEGQRGRPSVPEQILVSIRRRGGRIERVPLVDYSGLASKAEGKVHPHVDKYAPAIVLFRA